MVPCSRYSTIPAASAHAPGVCRDATEDAIGAGKLREALSEQTMLPSTTGMTSVGDMTANAIVTEEATGYRPDTPPPEQVECIGSTLAVDGLHMGRQQLSSCQ